MADVRRKSAGGKWTPIIAALLIFVLLAGIIASGNHRRGRAAAQASVQLAGDCLVIDPGHGGADGGASSADGLLESAVNLDIGLRLHALAGLFGVNSVMSRYSETLDYPESANTIRKKKVYDQKSRVELINNTPGAVLLSIHQNKFPSASPSGAQVLYADGEDSQTLAGILQENLVFALNANNRRQAVKAPREIYLMKSVNCTAVLVECGFLSNPEEVRLLKTDEYKTKLAVVIMASYLQFR